ESSTAAGSRTTSGTAPCISPAQDRIRVRVGRCNSNPGTGTAARACASAMDFPFGFRFILGLLRIAAVLAILAPARPSYATNGVEELLRETHWGESSAELLHQFGDEAKRLPHALD